eukprot:CAMPEP_0119400788 /NCGR_PEP_ID=MMETSP1334-20130426/142042_1 /TAXON_ID=127549 /ORGANISM="Calcidiscus leptoporus, Strain RCC1130" /LENGTH=314 /DNA_ID=CAMNT_0007424697 /DNA_START=118 /DNA_END=1062 /DNA_ORIENTATION=-
MLEESGRRAGEQDDDSGLLETARAQLADALFARAVADATAARLEREVRALRHREEAERGQTNDQTRRSALAATNATLPAGMASPWLNDLSKVFDVIDEDSDGVLTREEFRMGYLLLRCEEITAVFDAIDNNGDGVLTRDEFASGYALLVNDEMAHAELQRERVEREVARAVASERVDATKAAAKALAEAELMDALFPVGGEPAQTKERGGRLRPRSLAPYSLHGSVPDDFDLDKARRLVFARVRMRAAREFEQADQLQRKLGGMGVRVDDRRRAFWISQTPSQAGARASGRGSGARGRGRGRNGVVVSHLSAVR